MRIVHTLALDLAGTRTAVRSRGGLLGFVHRTTGLLGREVEEEVASMVDLCERVHRSLVEVGIDDVVRLVVDAEVVYEDFSRRPRDLETAFRAAIEHGLEGSTRLQVVLEGSTEALELVVKFDVYREHPPGAWPIWVRTTALPHEIVRIRRERRDRHRRRIDALLADEGRRREVQARAEASLGELLVPLERELRKRLAVEASRSDFIWRYLETGEDCFFTQSPEVVEAVEVATLAARALFPERAARGGTPYPEFVREGEEAIRRMEARLVPSRRDRKSGRQAGLTWEIFSRRKVYNPTSGKIAQIRSLPPRERSRYQAYFNSLAIDPSQRVDVYAAPGVFERMIASVGRGLTEAASNAMARLARHAPRTHAFIADAAYRKAAMKESAPLLGKELYDQADVLAHAIVGEIYETARLPLAWWSTSRKMTLDERDFERMEESKEQLLDLAELSVGTLVPVGAWAVGGPLAGVVGLAGVKVVQLALNWHAKRTGSREWTISPSRMVERRRAIAAKRAPERKARSERLEAVRRRNAPAEEGARRLEEELAETFREFGRMLEEDRVEFRDRDLEVSTFKDQDLIAAMEEEARVAREGGNGKSPGEGP